jgi:hypothetical protein
MEGGTLWNVKTIKTYNAYIIHLKISVAYLQSCLDTGILLAGSDFFYRKLDFELTCIGEVEENK